MNDWLAVLDRRLGSEPALVRVVVASIRGSAPREAGACMLVGNAGVQGSIGGGHLELKAIEIARHMLAREATTPRLDRFALGATLGQCCGGAVNLWFERYDVADAPFVKAALGTRKRGATVIATALHRDGGPQRAIVTLDAVLEDNLDENARRAARPASGKLLGRGSTASYAMLVNGTGERPLLLENVGSRHRPLWLFGAGHVGRAVVGVFVDLPFEITWIDSRAEAFPPVAPANVTMRVADAPVDEVRRAPRGAWFLVMTHSHDLDYDICRAILARDDYAWAGLIGSETKATCFGVRFARENIPARSIARLACPIGAGGIRSKLPGAIAVSVATQLLQVLQDAEVDNAEDEVPAACVPAGA